MSINDIAKRHHSTFDKLKHLAEGDVEFWYARDLQSVLDYSSWDKFKRVILKAITACGNAGQVPKNHFSQVGKMVKIGGVAL